MYQGFKNELKITRRDFIKTSLTAGAGASLLQLMNPEVAGAAWYDEAVANNYSVQSTCSYCSVGCGIRIGVSATGQVVDIKGNTDSPINEGSLCSKGQALVQLVNSNERLGVTGGAGAKGAGQTGSDPRQFNVPVKMIGTGSSCCTGMTWEDALTDIAAAMVAARGTTTTPTGNFNSATKQFSAAAKKKVAFFGSSHMNNEPNYIYRKLIANFGTNNTEHQARI